MKKTIWIIESISEWTGIMVSWAAFALVLLLCTEVFMRFVLDNPTQYSYETAISLGVTISAVGLAYTYKHHGHVRVDVIYRYFSPRTRALADVIGALIFFFPLYFALTYISVWWLWRSVAIGEILTETFWYPPAWPIRASMTLGIILIIPQGVAHFIRDLHQLRRKSL